MSQTRWLWARRRWTLRPSGEATFLDVARRHREHGVFGPVSLVSWLTSWALMESGDAASTTSILSLHQQSHWAFIQPSAAFETAHGPMGGSPGLEAGTCSPSSHRPRRGEKLGNKRVTDGQQFNHLCLRDETSLKPLVGGFGELWRTHLCAGVVMYPSSEGTETRMLRTPLRPCDMCLFMWWFIHVLYKKQLPGRRAFNRVS